MWLWTPTPQGLAIYQRFLEEYPNPVALAVTAKLTARLARLVVAVHGSDELLSLANMAAYEAIRAYRPSLGGGFSNAVVWRMRAAFADAVRDLRAQPRCYLKEFKRVSWQQIAVRLDNQPYTPPRSSGQAGDNDACAAVELVRIGLARLERRNARMAKVLRLRFFEGRTLQDIGALLGVSKERARQLEAQGLAHLRRAFAKSL